MRFSNPRITAWELGGKIKIELVEVSTVWIAQAGTQFQGEVGSKRRARFAQQASEGRLSAKSGHLILL
jgi:hypothetical protein